MPEEESSESERADGSLSDAKRSDNEQEDDEPGQQVGDFDAAAAPATVEA